MTVARPPVVNDPNPYHRARRAPIAGAIVHSMGEWVFVPGEGFVRAVEFLRRSKELTKEKYSAHCIIRPDGTVERLVDDDRAAYHAGQSKFAGLGGDDGYPGLNDTFLGAEWLLPGEWRYGDFIKAMAGTPPVQFTSQQYSAGGWLYAGWARRYGFGRDFIVSHAKVAGDDVRGPGKGKRDPGAPFDWKLFWASFDHWYAVLGNG